MSALSVSRIALAIIAVFAIAGLIELWPGDDPVESAAFQTATLEAEVVDVAPGACLANQIGGGPAGGVVDGCRRVTVEIGEGPDAGDRAGLDVSGGFAIGLGDRVRVAPTGAPAGAVLPGGQPADRYSFADFERRSALVGLAIVFAALVIVSARLKGLRALVALAASLAIILLFVVPAILDGGSPTAVALIGALAVMLVTIGITHGIGVRATAACLGTAVALLVTAVIANVAVDLAHITGFASEEATLLRVGSEQISLQGLLLAGIMIGALGVLDDLTISQASTVVALRRADPAMDAVGLFRAAMEVGRDHIVATVNTLVLAYVGASLPVLLIFSVAGTSFGDAINSEVVAGEIVATIVGSIGLMLAVPITTGLAAVLASRTPVGAIAPEPHGHVH